MLLVTSEGAPGHTCLSHTVVGIHSLNICLSQYYLADRVTNFVCSEREAHRADARRRESESENQLRDMHNLSNQLSNRNQPIQEYLAQNKAEALRRLTADLDACKKRQDKLEAEVQVKAALLW